MTGNQFLDAIVSLSVIGVLVTANWLVTRKGFSALGVDEARALLCVEEPDFMAIAWLVDDNGKAVLAEGAGGDFVLATRHGVDSVSRRFCSRQARIVVRPDELRMQLRDPSLPVICIVNRDAAKWARKFGVE